MLALTRAIDTFPSVSLPSYCGGLPVEVALIAQLGIGAGDGLIAGVSARQRAHESYIDALDEPSARIGGTDLTRGDATSLYTFSVGPHGHPFHRHAGHRVFTAVSGSAGAQLRFSTASAAQVAHDPGSFVRALHQVNIPPDCLFTVRFGGGTWHQFRPLHSGSTHPALFALSCHTNELGGELAREVRERVLANEADIPLLTDVLPDALVAVLERLDPRTLPTTALSLHKSPTSWQARACARTRGVLGRLQARVSDWRGARGFLADNGGGRQVTALRAVPDASLLRTELDGFHHEDMFALRVAPGEFTRASASEVMVAVLEGFLGNRPVFVSQMMAIRNMLVRPLGLRTSPLGCPVSSLLSSQRDSLFAGRFPVLAQRSDADGRRVQVLLGADDKHLSFRSCVDVERLAEGGFAVRLGTRVRNRNIFGHLYLALIDRVHRGYITPAMLRMAVDHAVRTAAGAEAIPAVADSGAPAVGG
jgi:hypothetical protein